MQGKVHSTPKLTEKECLTPRGHGEGDGIRHNLSARKRVPVSSARKFNARAPRDESLKLKLETALAEMEGRKPEGAKLRTPSKQPIKALLKSSSVAEITPTKTKRRLSMGSKEDSLEIYATPRPFNPQMKKTLCTVERNSCRLYRKLMLNAWRRSRTVVKDINKKIERQQEQMAQLELQIEVLSKLRLSESQKREDAQNECQKLKKANELLELENSQLTEETQGLRYSFDVHENELKVAKAENNFLSEQSVKLQDIVNQKKAEKQLLEEKIRHQEDDLRNQKELLLKHQDKLQTLQRTVKTLEVNYEIKDKKYTQLKCQFKNQLDRNNSISKHLQSLEEEKLDISLKVDDLEMQLNDYIRSCEELKDVNEELEQEVHDISMELQEERKHNWLRNTKHFALLSLSALQKIADVMVPVYLDRPANF